MCISPLLRGGPITDKEGIGVIVVVLMLMGLATFLVICGV